MATQTTRPKGLRRWLRRRRKVAAGVSRGLDGTDGRGDNPGGPPGAGVREPRRPKPSPPAAGARREPPGDRRHLDVTAR